MAYCSAECENLGWSVHQNDCNIHVTTTEPNLTVFIPEDSDESHLVRYLDPKRFAVESFVGGKLRNTKIKEFGGGAPVETTCAYQLKVNDVTIDLEPIFEGHDSKSVRQLAAKTKRSKLAVFHNKSRLNTPIKGTMRFTFYIDGKETTYLTGVLTSYDGNLIAKDNRQNKILLTLKDGVITHLFFSCPVSVVLKKQALLPSTDVPNRIDFKCNADDIDHVSGLIMALEDGMASGELEGMDNHFYVINAHREALEKNPDLVPNAKVNAAIHYVANAMWANHIEKSVLDRGQDFLQRIKDKRELKKITNNATLIDMLRKQVNEAEALQRDGANATDVINYASNIASELRRRKVLVSENPTLGGLYTRLNVLVKSKGAKRLAKMKESRIIKKEKKQEYEAGIEARRRARQLQRVPGMKDDDNEE
jgi:hypothetical protein